MTDGFSGWALSTSATPADKYSAVFAVTTEATWASPLPYNITAGRDLNGDLTNNDRPLSARRNAGGMALDVDAINVWRAANGLQGVTADDLDGANFFNWDLRLSRTFRLGNGVGVEGLVEAFNVTNRVNYLRYVTNSRLASLGQATLAGDPRQIQFGVRVTF